MAATGRQQMQIAVISVLELCHKGLKALPEVEFTKTLLATHRA